MNPRAFGPSPTPTSFTPGRTPRVPATGLARLSSGGGEFRSATAMQDLPTFRRTGLERIESRTPPVQRGPQAGADSSNPFSLLDDGAEGGDALEQFFRSLASPGDSAGATRPFRPQFAQQQPADAAGPDQELVDLMKGIGSAKRGVTVGRGLDRLSGDLLPAGSTFPTPGAELLREIGTGAPPQTDVFNPGYIGGPPPDGAGAGLSGSTISGGAGAVGALLGILGTATGNQDLQRAGNLLAATSSLYSLGSGIAGAAGAGSSAAAAAAPLTAGSTVSLALGALSVPLIVRSLIDMFAPDWSGPSHYARTRMLPEAQAKGTLLRINELYDQAARHGDAGAVWSALAARGGPAGQIGTSLNVPADVARDLGLPEGRVLWGSMTPEQFMSAMEWLRGDPARLSAIQGSGDIPYLEQHRAQGYADEAADYARNLIARHLGLPYKFVEPEHRLAIQSTRLGRSDGLGGAPDPQTLDLMVRQERAYQQAREAWQAAHPDIQLAPWTPQVLGHEAELARLWQHENYRDHGFGAG